MTEKPVEAQRFDWRLPLYFSIVGFAILLGIAICQADVFLFLNVFVVAPVLIVISIALPILLAFRHRRQLMSLMAALAILWAIAVSLFLYNREHPFALRETAKWLAWSQEYKKEILQQPSVNGDLKHIEWDGSGFAGVANNTAYLVFDPKDSLSAGAKGHQAFKFNGRTCEVRDIRRLESHWYAVLFYTDQTWDECN